MAGDLAVLRAEVKRTRDESSATLHDRGAVARRGSV
jgi:hypothetical protein